MPIDDRTTNRSYKLPNAGNHLADDVVRLRDALAAIDADVYARYTKLEVDQLITNLINGSPGALDTLNELAAALGNDANFASTVTNQLALKANASNVYSKAESDARYVQGQTQAEMVFIATAGQSVFTLSTAVINKPSALVTVDGVVQPTSEYSINMTGTQLTLSEGVPVGTVVRVLALGVSSEGAPADDTVTTVKLRDAAVTTEKLAPVIAPTVSSVNGGPLAGFRNLLINGNPIINQRGYLGANTTVANQYTLDRWRVVTSGQAITWSTNSGVRTVNAPAGGIEQVIEGESILGGTYTLSWTGTATATVNGVTIANGGTVALAGGLNATVRFINGTFSLAQLEPGTVATPFERRPVGQELALCQRYYEIQPFETYLGFPAPNATFAHIFPLFFMVPKRAIPTISYSINNMFNLASSSIVLVTPQSWSLQLVAAGNTNTVASTNFSASAEL